MTLADAQYKGNNAQNKRIYQAVIISDNTPSSLTITGADVIGMSADDVFAPGSLIIVVNEDKVYMAGENGTFVLQE